MPTARKIKKFRKTVVGLLVIATIMTAGYTAYQWQQYKRARFVRYPEFGIKIPVGYEIHGIDVSKYQSTIAWKEVKDMNIKQIRMSFAFIKATEGITNYDPQFNRNWNKCKDAGIFRGAYHFFVPTRDGKQQAENFIDKVSLETGDLPPVLDIEQLNGSSPENLRIEAKKWLNIVEGHYGVKPIIYTNVDFYTNYLGDDFDDYPFWAAHYQSEGKPRIKRNWIFWQHSDEGRVNGVSAAVDFNVFNGNYLDFSKLLID